MEFVTCERALRIIQAHPEPIRSKLTELRNLIVAVAQRSTTVTKLAESVKWGQPSYLSNCGSAVRIAWSDKSPRTVQMYVNCQTSLGETYRELYGNVLELRGVREIVLQLQKPLPTEILSHCIELALHYKRLRTLPMLGC